MREESASTAIEPKELDIAVSSREVDDDEIKGDLGAIARPIDDETVYSTAEAVVTGYAVVHTGSRSAPDVTGAVDDVVGNQHGGRSYLRPKTWSDLTRLPILKRTTTLKDILFRKNFI